MILAIMITVRRFALISFTCSNNDHFTFLSGEDDPTKGMPTRQSQRAKKAIKNTVAALSSSKEKEEGKTGGCSKLMNCCSTDLDYDGSRGNEESDKHTSSTEITREMQRASEQGWNMIKSIVFPALPALVQDIWVYLELFISIVAFILGLLDTFPIEDSHSYTYSYLVLATISMILALIDGYIYFIQLGSCARYIKDCRGKTDEEVVIQEMNSASSPEQDHPRCCRLSAKWKEQFNMWFELGRNLLSELILYPLLIFDLFDFIIGRGYNIEGSQDRINFSLFLIGGFYLILSVYVMRILIVAGSMLSLYRIPNNKGATGKDSDTFILVRFCSHILGQIAVHFMIILAIATKINNENPHLTERVNMTAEVNDGDITASPFLVTAIVLGWVVPIAGVMMFFVVNYYWMKEFSIGFWVNMISLLQGESFAETVFGGSGVTAAEEKALEFVEDSQYKQVKKQLLQFKSTPVGIKFFYPARIPITAISGLLYDILLLSFIACLMLTSEDGSVRVVQFSDDNVFTTVLVMSIIIIILANIQALILLNILLLIVLIIFTITAAIAIFISPLLLFVYFPILACLGYSFLFSRSTLRDKKQTSLRSGLANSQQLLKDESDYVTELEAGISTMETKSL